MCVCVSVSIFIRYSPRKFPKLLDPLLPILDIVAKYPQRVTLAPSELEYENVFLFSSHTVTIIINKSVSFENRVLKDLNRDLLNQVTVLQEKVNRYVPL